MQLPYEHTPAGTWRRFAPALLLAVAAIVSGAWVGYSGPAPTRAASTQCMPDTSSLAIFMKDAFSNYVSSEDSIQTSMRAGWGVPLLDPDSVVIVTDSATCRQAAEAYAREQSLSDSSFRVAVLRIQHMRVVVPEPEPRPAGPPFEIVIEHLFGIIFDSTFASVIERRLL